ncbi:MAG: glycosyltransferase family 1 protein [Xanthomonadales bacterium]|nr:glycosyltransferase family 1 protein [Xanthomonadales bacterium]
MRVGLDITQAVKRRGRGIARYIREILPRLADPSLQLDTTYCIRGARWWRRSLVADLQPAVPRSWLPTPAWLPTRGLDLFHSFGNHLPRIAKVPLTFTVHDFRALDRPLEKGVGGNRLRRNIERAAGILCLTEHGRDRLLHHYPDFDPQRLAVVPHGVDRERFHPQDPDAARATARRYGIESPYLLQLGSWFPHKNLELSIRAFARSRACADGWKLVFAGGGATAVYAARLSELAASECVAEQICWLEDLPGPDLPLLLAGARALLQPSRYEGFALPLLEAMAVGLPGVVSDSSCLPEVSGGIWPIAGQSDVQAFAGGIDAVALDGPFRDAAIRAGLERAAKFTWEETARRTAAFFHRVLAAG